ncbi:hypothetical protein N0V90_001917 [Kalmusia sp. IMI 367209]|nr:hypothetical protein N0V90_001917 [Kalmusia sp. IMI 367209]
MSGIIMNTIMDFDFGRNLSWAKNQSYTAEILQAAESRPYSSLAWATSFIVVLFFWFIRDVSTLSHIPMVTQKSVWDLSGKKAKEHWMVNCRGVVKEGFKKVGATNPFRVLMDLGEMLVLPPDMANDIRNIEELSHGDFMVETELMTEPMSDCVAKACPELFPEDNEWHEINMKNELLDLIARLSSAIFLGDEEVSTDPIWLNLTKNYTVDSFIAAHQLRMYPSFMWPIMAKILPQARKVNAQFKQAEAIINPIIERRRVEKARGELERFDAVEWAEQVSQEKGIPYSPAAAQLNMALSAIHTTADLITTTMYELLQSPKTIDLLREEIVSVISDGGLKHSSLYNLRLMDSVIKEAQRLKPVLSLNMVRKATHNIELPSGFQIPKGTRLGVPANASWDPAVFPEPEKFDPYRFVRLREQPGEEDRWQLTTLRSEQIAFGHGKHACPGRFLAANEIKIALCHLLLKYDWKLSPSTPAPAAISHGIMLDSDPTTKAMVRSRTAEVGL